MQAAIAHRYGSFSFGCPSSFIATILDSYKSSPGRQRLFLFVAHEPRLVRGLGWYFRIAAEDMVFDHDQRKRRGGLCKNGISRRRPPSPFPPRSSSPASNPFRANAISGSLVAYEPARCQFMNLHRKSESHFNQHSGDCTTNAMNLEFIIQINARIDGGHGAPKPISRKRLPTGPILRALRFRRNSKLIINTNIFY